jgi:hypothetical protein
VTEQTTPAAETLGGGNSSPDPADWDRGESESMTETFAAFSQTEEDVRADAERLPAPLSNGSGNLDVNALRTLAPEVRKGLTASIRHAVTLARDARGSVVVPEDTYPLVRQLTEAGEVLRQWRDAFEAAAKECDATLEEEALTAVGGLPGYEEAPSGSHFVPDGEGQRIAITPDWHSGESTWDTDTLRAWIAEQIIADEGVGTDTDRPVFTAQEAVSLVRDGMDKLLSLGNFTPGAAKIEKERKRLAGLQRDTDAAVLRQVRTVGPRRYKGVKITREAGK